MSVSCSTGWNLPFWAVAVGFSQEPGPGRERPSARHSPSAGKAPSRRVHSALDFKGMGRDRRCPAGADRVIGQEAEQREYGG